jgi:four helix bundle protein
MATFHRFEDIDAWKKGRELANSVYSVTSQPHFARDFALRDQIRRASVSVISNIAEGFGRSGTSEFIQFLSIAKGSVAEILAQLYIALDLGYLSQADFERLYELAAETSRLIGGLMHYLRKSGLKGVKYK